MFRSLLLLLLLATPVYSQGTVSWHPAIIATANTSKVGTGSVAVIITAEEARYVDKLVFRAVGTNIQTVVRLFINNGDPNTEARNNILFAEKTLAATTLSETTALADNEMPLDITLQPGQRLFCTLGTTVAAGWVVSAVTKSPTEIVE